MRKGRREPQGGEKKGERGGKLAQSRPKVELARFGEEIDLVARIRMVRFSCLVSAKNATFEPLKVAILAD